MSVSEIVLALLAAGGSGFVVAYLVLRYIATSWLDSLFAQKLESFRHENAKELQSLKAEIDGTLNLRFRVQEKEFECLTELWDLMNEALGTAQRYVSPFQQYPVIRNMPRAAQDEYLNSLEVFEFQKREILDSDSPDDTLQRFLDLTRMNSAREAHANFHNATSKFEILLSQQTADDFKSVAKMIREAILGKEISKDDRDFKMGREAWDKLENDVAPQVDRISSTLRGYLRSTLA